MIVLENKKIRQMISSVSKNQGTPLSTKELVQQLQIEESEFNQLKEQLVNNLVVETTGDGFVVNREGYRAVIQKELPVVWEVIEHLGSIRDRISSVSVYNSPQDIDLASGTIIVITDTESEKLIHKTLQTVDFKQYKLTVVSKSQLLQSYETHKEDSNTDNLLEIEL